LNPQTWTYLDHSQRETRLPDSVAIALQVLRAEPDIKTIILFGSRAVGDHDERSDFDIAISADGIDRQKLALLRDKIGQSPTLFKIAVTLLESMPPALRQRVVTQGVVIYERA